MKNMKEFYSILFLAFWLVSPKLIWGLLGWIKCHLWPWQAFSALLSEELSQQSHCSIFNSDFKMSSMKIRPSLSCKRSNDKRSNNSVPHSSSSKYLHLNHLTTVLTQPLLGICKNCPIIQQYIFMDPVWGFWKNLINW